MPWDESNNAASDASMESNLSYNSASNTSVLESMCEIESSMFARRLSTASSSFCRAFWCNEAAYIKSCFSSSSVSGTVPQPLEAFLRSGRVERWIRLTRNTSTNLSRASMPASRYWSTELDTAPTDDSMARNLLGKWASHSRCSRTASWPDSTCCTPLCAATLRHFVNTARAGAKYSTIGANTAITAKLMRCRRGCNAARAGAAITANTGAMYTTSCNTVIS